MFFSKFFILVLLLVNVSLVADENTHNKALDYYESKNYLSAFPLFLQEAKAGHKASEYRVAYMYERGLGVSIDMKMAAFWYKKASEKYAYSVHESESNTSSFWNGLHRTFGNENFELGNEFIYNKLGTSSPASQKAVQRYTSSGVFGLQAYQTNFILPLSIAQEKPALYRPQYPVGVYPDEFYDKKVEVEFQLSLKKQLTYDLFGWNEFIYGAYTQKVWWQLYSDSGPFRETNYLPEFYMSIPTSASVDDAIGLKFVKFGFIHESNGQDGFRSRSWNRLYLTGQWQWSNFFVSTRAWYRLPEERKSDRYYAGDLFAPNTGNPYNPDGTLIVDPNEAGDDNPDILEYLGYGDIKVDYLYNDHQVGLLLRNNLNFNDNKGAIELNWSHPVLHSEKLFYYVKLFHGYGENLITYDTKTTKTSFGFAVTRGLFQ